MILVFSFVFLSSFIIHSHAIPKVLVVSFDGFRYDFINRNLTPNLSSIISKSTKAKFVINVFPTKTFTNHFSIATGLYSEHHGVIGNKVYDKKTKKVLPYGYDLWHYNKSVEPIWTVNQKAGGNSGVMMWPGGEFAYSDTNTTYNMKFNASTSFQDRVQKIIEWFSNKKNPANLVMMYFEQPDAIEHAYGPDAIVTNKMIKLVDEAAGYILNEIEKAKLLVNIIFLSDHGMQSVMRDKILNLQTWTKENAEYYGISPVLQVYPKLGKDEEVYDLLKNKSKENGNFRIFKKDEIPDRFHYKNCERAPPILALADPPFVFQDMYESILWYQKTYNVSDKGPFGVHGYDPETITMHPYFIGYGPSFKKNYSAGAIHNVDIFSLVTKLLELDPQNKDGSLERIQEMLWNSASKTSSGLYFLLTFIIIFVHIFQNN